MINKIEPKLLKIVNSLNIDNELECVLYACDFERLKKHLNKLFVLTVILLMLLL